MKTVVGISLGSAAQDFSFTTEFLGEKLHVKRVGTDGSVARAVALIRHWDAEADAIGLGVLKDRYRAGTHRFVEKDSAKLKAVAKQALTTVSQVDPIRAYIYISEQDYMRFATRDPGQEPAPVLELILADGSHHTKPGKFYVADRQVDATTGTIKVATLFPNPGNILRPGQYARIRAKLKVKRGALLVPQRAVTELQGGFQIAVVKPDNTVDIRSVKPAERVGALWVIDEGLSPGDTIVTEGVQKVRQGMTVRPQPVADTARPILPAPPQP